MLLLRKYNDIILLLKKMKKIKNLKIYLVSKKQKLVKISINANSHYFR